MAKPLILSLDGQEFPVKLAKIDRERLYGAIEIEAFDENGNEAFLRVLAADGKTLINKGGTALATVNEDGNSVDRKELIAVNSDGEEIEPVPSSFAAANVLASTTIEDYLSHTVKSVYILEPTDEAELDFLQSNLSGNNILKFQFSYRGGLEYDSAFLIENKGDVFMVVGTQASLQFVKLSQATVLDSIEEQEISGDELDFDLL